MVNLLRLFLLSCCFLASSPIFADDFIKGKPSASSSAAAPAAVSTFTLAPWRGIWANIFRQPFAGGGKHDRGWNIHRGKICSQQCETGWFVDRHVQRRLDLGASSRHERHRYRHARVGVPRRAGARQPRMRGAPRKRRHKHDQWFASKTPIKLGGLSPGNSTSDVARILAASLNLPIQLVEGYKGNNEVRLAVDGGELHGGCWAWETLKLPGLVAIPAGEVNVVLQVSAKKQPDLSSVPLALDLAKTDEARQLLKAGAIDPAAIVRVYVTTPRVPKDRLQILRNAFARTLSTRISLLKLKRATLISTP